MNDSAYALIIELQEQNNIIICVVVLMHRHR
jgi:hypothetical protein